MNGDLDTMLNAMSRIIKTGTKQKEILAREKAEREEMESIERLAKKALEEINRYVPRR